MKMEENMIETKRVVSEEVICGLARMILSYAEICQLTKSNVRAAMDMADDHFDNNAILKNED